MRDRRSELFEGKPVMVFNHEQDRRSFLKWAGIVGVGAGLAASGALRSAGVFAQGENSDIDILNYALTLEYLEAEFYKRGIDANVLSGRELELVRPILSHEQSHVATITATVKKLGGKPVDKPKFRFPDGTFTDKAKFLKTATTFEETGVDAYHGQVTKLKSKELLAAAASIAGVESRHAAILNKLTDGQPFPAPIEDSKTMQQILEIVDPFIEKS